MSKKSSREIVVSLVTGLQGIPVKEVEKLSAEGLGVAGAILDVIQRSKLCFKDENEQAVPFDSINGSEGLGLLVALSFQAGYESCEYKKEG